MGNELTKLITFIIAISVVLSASQNVSDHLTEWNIKRINPKWTAEILDYPSKVSNGSSYNITLRVTNRLPIKDTINIQGYFYHLDQYENYTINLGLPYSSITLEGKTSKTFNGTLIVPSNYPQGYYYLTFCVTYGDVEPWIYRDRRLIKLEV